jgi:mannose-6-phosphate isomerase-like protein (cupin superfamily)
MKFSFSASNARRVDNALTIVDLFKVRDFSFDCVIADLNGIHHMVINRKSDRMYFVLEGNGEAVVGEDTHSLSPYDLVAIPKGTKHSISGHLKYVIITAPPFDPADEDIV